MDVKKFIFESYKNEVIKSKSFKEHIREKFNIDVREAHDIFVKIKNYQIEKFGEPLSLETNKTYMSCEDCFWINKRARQRKYDKKRGNRR